MSEEQLKAFLEKVKSDTSLQEKLKAAADSDAVLAIAKETGFMISADNLKNALSELLDKEMEGMAGGGDDWGYPTKVCGRGWDKAWDELLVGCRGMHLTKFF